MLVHPSQIKAAARRVDDIFWSVLETSAGSAIPRQEQGLGYEAVVQVPVTGLQGLSFQAWVAQLSISQGGLGIRRQVDSSHSAYIGALEQTVPHFTGERGVCPQLAHLVGREEDGEDRRWEPLVTSNCRTGRELSRAWEELQREAVESCAYLDRELPDILASEVLGVGLGSEDGTTRKRITEEREKIRAAVFMKGLADYPDPASRAVIAWKNRDKLSTAFLTALPGPHSSLSSPQFGEALCLLLCLPALCCRDRVGQKVGRRRVDLYGEEVVNENLAGGGFTRRHDAIKLELNSMAAYCGLTSTCEPYGLFGSLLPQQPLNRLEYRMSKVVLRPDFLLELPDQPAHQTPRQHTGRVVQHLADVKTVSLGGRSYYKPGVTGNKAVKIRAGAINSEYKRKAVKMDQQLGHTDEQGPALRRLRQYEGGNVLDLVFGGYSECSEGVWTLLGHMANSRLKKLGLARGSPGSQQELSLITGSLRRRLSLAVHKANLSLLLDRMRQIGDGAEMAGRRRNIDRLEEERGRWDRQAEWMARVTGRDLVRKGQFLIE
jgi:hypothetical protein